MEKKLIETISDEKMYNVGAIALNKNGKIIGTGTNSFTQTHPMQKEFGSNKEKIYLHAEIDALIKCKRKKCFTLIICRVSKTGLIKNSKPCSGCEKAIRYFDVNQVFYTNDFGELILLDELV